MTVLSDEAKSLIAEHRPSFIATADENGRPNVSPKGSFQVLDDEHVLFADVQSPRTVANLRQNPQASAIVFDPVTNQGCRVWGTTEIVDSGNDHVFAYVRHHDQYDAFVLANFSEQEQRVEARRLRQMGMRKTMVDVYAGRTVTAAQELLMGPYQFMVLARVA